ncbi:DUF2236 domain-containing protein [Nocardioides humilatus]|uniref:DUF2236 domain-containing protein n=1 Tax=Nocardioides humilatus TaxID=2607660 RepID=A0A5B1L8F6_9ACTN|nr:oxygenase MpaB family protein [Nocardioides humilatus]KAA1416973.1 DUF2236 domain-containing protein [Nocardioides humilatus]
MTDGNRKQQNVSLWRRGGAPTAAGPQDFGCYGPDSIAWKLLSHSVVPAMTVQVTALLQFTHAGMSANMIDHDPLFEAGRKGRARPDMFVNRHRRTFGVVVPAILGDQATAGRICTHLRHVHRNMQGVIPRTDTPYDAAGPELVLFGHVTLMHAALMSYERAGYHGLRPPSRLTDAERDRFWAEVVPFAVMMGANEADVPRSAAEVEAFYESCEADYYNFDLMLRESLRSVGDALRPSRWRHPVAALTVTSLTLSHFLALGIIPPPARRHAGIPAGLDPVIDVLFHASRPAYAVLGIPAVGDALVSWMVGPDSTDLIANARRLMEVGAQDTERCAA